MGAVSRDLTKKARDYEEKYPYDIRGIAEVLKDYYKLESSRFYNGDVDATGILADILNEIDGDCLTARQRQCFALYYFARLKLRECAVVLGLDESVVKKHVKGGLKRLAARIDREARFSKGDPIPDYTEDNALYGWLNAIKDGAPIGEPTAEIFRDIAEILRESDDKSDELLRQHADGYVMLPDDSEYTCLTEGQMKWADRRVTYVEEVFPPGDTVGSQRVAAQNTEDKKGIEFRDERRKMFKLRGN
jgi:DNA-binding CsgD family transcriptional regulator